MGLLSPRGQGEPRFLSSWTKASIISSFIFCSSFRTSSRSSCFTLSKSESSLELGVEGWASEVVTEDDDFILGKVVLFFSQGLRTDSLWAGTRASGSSLAESSLGGFSPTCVAFLLRASMAFISSISPPPVLRLSALGAKGPPEASSCLLTFLSLAPAMAAARPGAPEPPPLGPCAVGSGGAGGGAPPAP